MTIVDRGLNAAVLHIAQRLMPAGFDVCPDAPETFDALRERVERTGRMCVSSENSDNTIFGDPEVNYAFRAWHDWHHLSGNHAFTLEGERQAARGQMRDLITLYGLEKALPWCALLDAEVSGQARYAAQHDRFPTDQVGFDLAYLANPAEALARADW